MEESKKKTVCRHVKLKLPLKQIEEDCKNMSIKTGSIETVMVSYSADKVDNKLEVFSNLTNTEKGFPTLTKLFSYYMFDNKKEGEIFLAEKMTEIKLLYPIDEDYITNLTGTIYEEYCLSVYLKVEILLCAKSLSPKRLLCPLVYSSHAKTFKETKWPKVYINKSKDNLYYIIKESSFATKKSLDYYLDKEILPLLTILKNDKIKLSKKDRKYLPPPYSQKEWKRDKCMADAFRHYTGITSGIKSSRNKDIIVGIKSGTTCVIKDVFESKGDNGNETIIEVIKDYLFSVNSIYSILHLILLIKETIEYFQMIKVYKNVGLTEYLAHIGNLLKFNLCFYVDNHFVSLNNVLPVKYGVEVSDYPIVGIMKKDERYYIINKMKYGEYKCVCHLIKPHSEIENIIFKHFKSVFESKDKFNSSIILAELLTTYPLLEKDRDVIENAISELFAKIKVNSHENDNFNYYCEIVNDPTKIVDVFTNKPLDERTSSEREGKSSLKRKHEMISNDENLDILAPEEMEPVEREKKISADEEDIDVVEKQNTHAQATIVEEGTIVIDAKTKEYIWIPNIIVEDLLSANIQLTPNTTHYHENNKINWSGLQKSCRERDCSTPKTMAVFQKNVRRIWKQIADKNISKNISNFGRISFNIEEYSHLQDNGLEIIGMISEKKHSDQIILKIDPTTDHLDTNVYIYNLQNEFKRDSKVGEIKKYYRCAGCKQVEDEWRRDVKNGKKDPNEHGKPKGATMIKMFYLNDTIGKITSGLNGNHCEGCQPISLLTLIASQYERKVKMLATNSFLSFDFAYRQMQYATMKLANLHKIPFHNILIHAHDEYYLREQCQRLHELKGKERLDYINTLKYTVNSVKTCKDKLLRWESDDGINYDSKNNIINENFIIFGSPTHYKEAAKCDVWMGGKCTTIVTRKNFKHVYTIHGRVLIVNQNSNEFKYKYFPLFSICMNSSDEQIYQKAMNKIFDVICNEYHLTLHLNTFVVDKDMEEVDGFQRVFKSYNCHVKMELCYIHFVSKLCDELQMLNLLDTYIKWKKDRRELYIFIKRLFCIPFLPKNNMVYLFKKCKNDILKRIEILIELAQNERNDKLIEEYVNNERSINYFCKYIYDTWLESNDKINFISKYDSGLRTTKVCEKFNDAAKKAGCNSSCSIEKSLSGLRNLFNETELELKRIYFCRFTTRVPKKRGKNLNQELKILQSKYNFNIDSNCYSYLDDVSSLFLSEKIIENNHEFDILQGFSNVEEPETEYYEFN